MKQRRTREDYLKTICLLQKNNGHVWGVDIAEQLGVSKPTVSISLKQLEEEGYLFLDDTREAHLTDAGQKIAEATLERYQTFKILLESLGVDSRTAAEDACLMEHAVSPKSYRALKALAAQKMEKGGGKQK